MNLDGFSMRPLTEELSEKLGISQKSLSKIETGRNFLTSETLEKLLLIFDLKTIR